ncbi:hypothetical protein N7540_010345 [Penicillium herquei]|nr:hypothetical protein N7540_010345 [Penicillium herquei]
MKLTGLLISAGVFWGAALAASQGTSTSKPPTSATTSANTASSTLHSRSDGICYIYTFQGGDTCQSVATAYGLTVAEIEEYNANDWEWPGCSGIQQGYFLCLSSGEPPMPVSLPEATCGPQVPGTARPGNYSDLSSLNPCKDDACSTHVAESMTTKTTSTQKTKTTSETINTKESDSTSKSQSTFETQSTSSYNAESTTTKPTSTQKTKNTSESESTTESTSTHKTESTSKSKSQLTSKESSKASATTTTTSHTKTSDDSITAHKTTFTIKPLTTLITESITTVEIASLTSTATWAISIYQDLNCKGDYGRFVLHGNVLANSKCLVLHGGLSEVISGTDASCEYYADDEAAAEVCDLGKEWGVVSWELDGADCDVYSSTCIPGAAVVPLTTPTTTCYDLTWGDPHLWMTCGAFQCTLT